MRDRKKKRTEKNKRKKEKKAMNDLLRKEPK